MRRLMIAALVVLLLAAPTVTARTERLTILSTNFSEVHILGEAVKILLQENLGVEVEHIKDFSAQLLLHNAMLAGDADAAIYHTGTQFTGVLGMEVTDEWKDREKVFAYVNEQYNERFETTWLKPFGFNSTYAITVRKELAEEHNLKTMSDLQGLSETMTLGMDAVFRDRPGDGYEAMNEMYGLKWGRPLSMDYGLIYRATATGDVDAAVAYATDGRIPAMDLVALEDDLGFFPPYDCSLVVKNEILEKYPEIEEILMPLFGNLDDETMAYYNQLVDVEQMDFREVARILVNDFIK
ncbi:MAG TPA: osmoprotectant ABC transporter substrate-binding protein [Firmicutes bacterium]|nr:osmoprotectant ABC transporter substrate-binding protein [Bacillota bacterium]